METNKKIFKIIGIVAIVSVPLSFLGLFIWQMNKPNEASTTKHVIIFKNGDEVIKTVKVANEGYCPQYWPDLADGALKLSGWKLEKNGIVNFDLNTHITQDITLYANYSDAFNYELEIEREGLTYKIIDSRYFNSFSAEDLMNTKSDRFICTIDLNRLWPDERLGPNILFCDDLNVAEAALVQPRDLEMWLGNQKLVEDVDYKYESDDEHTYKITWTKPIGKSNKIMTLATSFDGQWENIKQKGHDVLIEIINPVLF